MEKQMIKNQDAILTLLMDQNLEKIDGLSNEFNPFRVLGIEKYEIRHSNFLGWLLDPSENHLLGDYLLKKFMLRVIVENQGNQHLNVEVSQVLLKSFGDTLITREKNHIDILGVSHHNKMVVLIENKVHAKESEHQLQKYYNYVKEKYSGYIIFPVFLTLTGDDPQNCEKYLSLSYGDIYQMVAACLEQKKEQLPIQVASFIEYYLKTLHKKLDMDSELKELCLQVYKSHKGVIDMINEVVDELNGSLHAVFEKFLENYNKPPEEFEVLLRSGQQLWFLPMKIIPQETDSSLGWRVPYPFAFRFGRKNDKIHFVIEVGPFAEKGKRDDFLRHLRGSYNIKESAFKDGAQYTRIFSAYTDVLNFEELEDEDIYRELEALYFKAKPEIEKFSSVVEPFRF